MMYLEQEATIILSAPIFLIRLKVGYIQLKETLQNIGIALYLICYVMEMFYT